MGISKEKKAKYNHKYYTENKDKINKQKSRYYQKTKEKRLSYFKLNREINKRKRKAQNYAKNNHFKGEVCDACYSLKNLDFHHVNYDN